MNPGCTISVLSAEPLACPLAQSKCIRNSLAHAIAPGQHRRYKAFDILMMSGLRLDSQP